MNRISSMSSCVAHCTHPYSAQSASAHWCSLETRHQDSNSSSNSKQRKGQDKGSDSEEGKHNDKSNCPGKQEWVSTVKVWPASQLVIYSNAVQLLALTFSSSLVVVVVNCSLNSPLCLSIWLHIEQTHTQTTQLERKTKDHKERALLVDHMQSIDATRCKVAYQFLHAQFKFDFLHTPNEGRMNDAAEWYIGQ